MGAARAGRARRRTAPPARWCRPSNAPVVRAAMSRHVGVRRDERRCGPRPRRWRPWRPERVADPAARRSLVVGDDEPGHRGGSRRGRGTESARRAVAATVAPTSPNRPTSGSATSMSRSAAPPTPMSPWRRPTDRRRRRSMFTFHPLSESTRARLLSGGLDPDAVAALVRMAVAEDLMGGIDVTSAATVPAAQRSRSATFGARAARRGRRARRRRRRDRGGVR